MRGYGRFVGPLFRAVANATARVQRANTGHRAAATSPTAARQPSYATNAAVTAPRTHRPATQRVGACRWRNDRCDAAGLRDHRHGGTRPLRHRQTVRERTLLGLDHEPRHVTPRGFEVLPVRNPIRSPGCRCRRSARPRRGDRPARRGWARPRAARAWAPPHRCRSSRCGRRIDETARDPAPTVPRSRRSGMPATIRCIAVYTANEACAWGRSPFRNAVPTLGRRARATTHPYATPGRSLVALLNSSSPSGASWGISAWVPRSSPRAGAARDRVRRRAVHRGARARRRRFAVSTAAALVGRRRIRASRAIAPTGTRTEPNRVGGTQRPEPQHPLPEYAVEEGRERRTPVRCGDGNQARHAIEQRREVEVDGRARHRA